MRLSTFLALVALRNLSTAFVFAEATKTCTSNADCVSIQGLGSECLPAGVCSNPFESGCLSSRLPGWTRKRVCNSDDPPDASARGVCDPPAFDYMEVRIASGDWESIAFNAWVLQILLSEMLGVPTTLESGLPDVRVNLYDASGGFEWGTVDNIEGIAGAAKFGDCRKANRDASAGPYEMCLHLTPEHWSGDLSNPWVKESIADGTMVPPSTLGAFAQESLFIPKFTVERDPTLISYIGMQGQKNRRKMAETFLRPTLWRDYCIQVSTNNCTSPDGVAERAPLDEAEGNQYHAQGLYTGHFRKTKDNVCNENATDCSGHLIDYPCQWNSYAQPQMYHLDIALSGDNYEQDSRGYSVTHMVQIITAAFETKSNIILMWARPDGMYQTFVGTDNELHEVTMPPTTQECLENRVPWVDTCSGDFSKRVGDPRGVCAAPPVALRKTMSTSLPTAVEDPSIAEAAKSPAIEAINLFTMTTETYGDFFDLVIERDAHRGENLERLRDATCQWVIDNIERVTQFVPFSYPRMIEDGQENLGLVIASIVFSALAVLLVVISSLMVYINQKHAVMKFAQVDFLGLLLSGFLLVSIAALVIAAGDSDASCVSAIWLVNAGYTLELGPLLVKVAAINKLVTASRRMKRVTLSRKSLYGKALVIAFLVAVFLIAWTAVDPPKKQEELTLSNDKTDLGETVVYRTYYCSSDSPVWLYVAFAWTGILLFSASVLAVQTRNVRQTFNECQTLAIMTYSHFVFAVLRVVSYSLGDQIGRSTSDMFRSLLLSVDTITAICIYFLPKFLVLRKSEAPAETSNVSNRNRVSWQVDLQGSSCTALKCSREESSSKKLNSREESGSRILSSPEEKAFQSESGAQENPANDTENIEEGKSEDK